MFCVLHVFKLFFSCLDKQVAERWSRRTAIYKWKDSLSGLTVKGLDAFSYRYKLYKNSAKSFSPSFHRTFRNNSTSTSLFIARRTRSMKTEYTLVSSLSSLENQIRTVSPVSIFVETSFDSPYSVIHKEDKRYHVSYFETELCQPNAY